MGKECELYSVGRWAQRRPSLRTAIYQTYQDKLCERVGTHAFHGFLYSCVVPFKAPSVSTESFKILLLQGSRTASLIFVTLLKIKSVEVVGAAEIWIQQDFSKKSFVEFDRIKLWPNLVFGHTSKGRQDTRKELATPPRHALDGAIVLGNVLVRKARRSPRLGIKASQEKQPREDRLHNVARRSRRGVSVAEDSFETTVPPLASTLAHGVAHTFPDVHGRIDIRRAPDGPPFVVGEFRITEHADF